jgi:aryl-alcohol dehydrogenase-like predicted oxidoreductase
VVSGAGTITYAGQTVNRLGFGAMRITGPGVWGYPADRPGAIAVLRRAVELGVDFIDTADSYGPQVSEELICEALHPYGFVRVATKAGLLRTGPGVWVPCGRPEYLRQQCELSMRRLGQEALDLFQLHRIDPGVSAEDQFGLLADLLAEGKVRAVGLSQVTVAEIEAARRVVPVASVQNLYNVLDRSSEDVLAHCEREGLAFIPWYPVAAGRLAEPGTEIDEVARDAGLTVAQVSIAWLLARSSATLPIPGTSQLAHLEENCAAAAATLSDSEIARLTALAS